ncbi:probable transcription factor At1g11510 [Aristolochia californica]|uniref:probable transcription factor At1g11510 n=1 Tax=Aristolochia californica TaxID=171875 RepID=UPI0035DAEA52
MATNPSPLTIPIKTAARKLPVKRKLSDSDAPMQTPKVEPSLASGADDDDDLLLDDEPLDLEDDVKPPPFKFHRIWPEIDEIRFLQSLLDSAADGLVYPRDLNLFYDRFSQSMSQPYTKSQLSEKLRRLRKKFRVLSARLSRGLDSSLLTPHDRALFHLSKQLWHPSFAATSPFAANIKKKNPKVRARASSSPPPATHPSSSPQPPDSGGNPDSDLAPQEEDEEKDESVIRSSGLGRCSAKAVMDVFDSSLKDIRTVLIRRGLLFPDHASGSGDLTQRWREQRVAELDVLARRLRLVLEQAVHQ